MERRRLEALAIGVAASLLAMALAALLAAQPTRAWLQSALAGRISLPGWLLAGLLLLAALLGATARCIAAKLPGRRLWCVSRRELRFQILDVVALTTGKSKSFATDATLTSYVGESAAEKRVLKERDSMIRDGLLRTVSPGGRGLAYTLTTEGADLHRREWARRQNLPKYHSQLG